MKSMIRDILSISGHFEVFARRIATFSKPLKMMLKKKMKANGKTICQEHEIEKVRNGLEKTLRNCGVQDGDIVLIHSSMDGLTALGMSPMEIVQLLLDIFGNAVTLVFTTFPMENRKQLEKGKNRKFNVEKFFCWTGMLPNTFLQIPGVIRSEFPYNTLSAIGPDAEKMFLNEKKAIRPHDENTAWYYCTSHHAKILFLGTTSIEANTILDHMAPDIMGEQWPIKGWYERAIYEIKTAENRYTREVEYQKGFWTTYAMEYKTDKLLKRKGILKDISTNIPLEIVEDAGVLLDLLINNAKRGKLNYQIPKKYWKKKGQK